MIEGSIRVSSWALVLAGGDGVKAENRSNGVKMEQEIKVESDVKMEE